jgi:hypothetical protein
MAFNSVGPVIFESVSQTTASPSHELGTRVHASGEEYVYCYNNTGSAVTQGAIMIKSGASGYSLSRSSTAALDFAVVGVKHAALAAGDYFWGLVRGDMEVMSVAMAAGSLLQIGADGAVTTAAVGSFTTGPVIGKCLLVSTANTKPLCNLRLFG